MKYYFNMGKYLQVVQSILYKNIENKVLWFCAWHKLMTPYPLKEIIWDYTF